jgi:hypothetical protein
MSAWWGIASIPSGIHSVVWAMEVPTVIVVVNRADVLGKKKIECPIKRDANFLIQAGQFAQVDRPRHPLGEEAREIESKNLGHAHTDPPNFSRQRNGNKTESAAVILDE